MLKRVKIQGYKSLVDIEVQLQPLSVLFGPNAAGKSNFLDALQLLSRIATSARLKDAFAPPYRGTVLESFSFGVDGVQGLLTQEKVSFLIEVDVDLTPSIIDSTNRDRQISQKNLVDIGIKTLTEDESAWFRPIDQRHLRYGIKIENFVKRGILSVAEEYLFILNEQGHSVGKSLLPQRDFSSTSSRTTYDSDSHDLILLTMVDPIFYPYSVAMRRELAEWFFFYLEPRERMRISSPIREVHRIGEMGEDISAFLNILYYVDETQFRAIESALHMVVPSITGINVDTNNLGEVELTFMEGQTPISSRIVSDGTLRMLGLLALTGVKEKSSLIGFEEPENGIHPRRLQLVASLLKSRAMNNSQVIVTTHSPGLLDFIPHENLFMCYKRNGHTIIEPFSNREMPDINNTLDGEEEELMVSERVLRGDFDA